MTTNLVVPQLGTEITEAEITEWLKAAGDPVEKDEPMVTLTTTKMSMDIEAPASGIISEILVEEGELAEVGAVLAIINDKPS
jgi:pyruvate/2-oxoglutarate dehydrogenase complex dihydrolipoamide acyltransferase (E2) component